MDQCIWNLCNSNCIMCTNPFGFRSKEAVSTYTKDNVLKLIESGLEKSDDENVSLTGGEPTIHPNFIEILEGIRKIDPRTEISFATNGRRFFYPEFAKKVLSFDNLQIRSVVHSAKQETHDAITRAPGSFKQTIKGVENLFKNRRRSHVINLRIVLLKQNHEELNEILEMIDRKFGRYFLPQDKIALIFPEYEGRAKKNFEEVKLTYNEIRPIVQDALSKWASNFYNKLYLYHFPLCTVDSSYWGYVARSIPLDNDEYTYLDKCDNCKYKKYCVRIHEDYIELVGESEFSPIKKKKIGEDLKIDEDDFHHPFKKR